MYASKAICYRPIFSRGNVVSDSTVTYMCICVLLVKRPLKHATANRWSGDHIRRHWAPKLSNMETKYIGSRAGVGVGVLHQHPCSRRRLTLCLLRNFKSCVHVLLLRVELSQHEYSCRLSLDCTQQTLCVGSFVEGRRHFKCRR